MLQNKKYKTILVDELLSRSGDFYYLITDWLLLEESDKHLKIINKDTNEQIIVKERLKPSYSIEMLPILASVLDKHENYK